ncbi:DUF823 domain-containing adhesin [Photobacterium makurazakiensis]|uniref:adhesion domain-containing protein n=1 Tax=Photobacterium makurazakiensis TaxID=2910234 RepID=UPI003D0D235D
MKNTNLFITLSLQLVLLLSGCGGDSSAENGTGNQSVDTVSAPWVENNFTQLQVDGETNTVSLKGDVADPQGLPVTLESVRAVSGECGVSELDKQGLSFTVSTSTPESCYYEYTVTNHAANAAHSKSANADSYVVVSSSSQSANLVPVALMATEGDTLAVDLKNLTEDQAPGYTYPEGYLLDVDVLVMGTGTVINIATSSATFQYEAEDQGVTRLIYSLISADGSDVKAGYIDVAVSAMGNNMPTAESIKGPEGVPMGEEIVIDVSPYIDDPDDEDNLQLTDVYTLDATVKISDPSDIYNTRFTFRADSIGVFYVTYYITDHRGGWAVGVISIGVTGPPRPWDDITLANGAFYSAPWDKDSADAYNIFHQIAEPELMKASNEEGETETEEVYIALFDQQTAQTVCSLTGMNLPNTEQLKTVYQELGGVKEKENWPTNYAYWTSDASGGGYNRVNLSTGEDEPAMGAAVGNLTCVPEGRLDVTLKQQNIFAGIQEHEVTATVSDVVDGSSLEGQSVFAYSMDDNLRFNNQFLQTDESGNAVFLISRLIGGTADLIVNYGSQSKVIVLKYIENLIASIESQLPEVVYVGQTFLVNTIAQYENGDEVLVTDKTELQSSDESVLSVNSSSVTGVAAGEVSLTSSFQDLQQINPVEVRDPIYIPGDSYGFFYSRQAYSGNGIEAGELVPQIGNEPIKLNSISVNPPYSNTSNYISFMNKLPVSMEDGRARRFDNESQMWGEWQSFSDRLWINSIECDNSQYDNYSLFFELGAIYINNELTAGAEFDHSYPLECELVTEFSYRIQYEYLGDPTRKNIIELYGDVIIDRR